MNALHGRHGRARLALLAVFGVTACGDNTELLAPADGAAAKDVVAEESRDASDGKAWASGPETFTPDAMLAADDAGMDASNRADDLLPDRTPLPSDAHGLPVTDVALPFDLRQADGAAYGPEASPSDLPVSLTPDMGDGKQPSAGLDCTNAIVPNNLVNGGVTDFSDWKSSKWGNTAGGLWGYVYGYGDVSSRISFGASAADKNLRAMGTVMPGGYAGFGVSFGVCTTVTSFTQLQFTAGGTYPGCDLEVQIRTFDQQPTTGNPAGGCDTTAPAGCFNFPTTKKVVFPANQPAPVVIRLSDVAGWSEANARQVIGFQWQWSPNADLDPDAGIGCPIDVTITDIRFVP